MFIHTVNCCGEPPVPPLPVTRPPCGRELMSQCGAKLQNTILDQIWGKPLWLRSKIKEIGGVNKPPKGTIEYEKIIQTGDPNGMTFNRDKADPAWNWDNTIPVQPYSTCKELDYFGFCEHYNWEPPEGYGYVPYWPESMAHAAAETDIPICDNKYYRYLAQYPSVGRPFQKPDANLKSQGLMNSNIVPDLFPGKQVETYNYTTGNGNLDIRYISHDKNQQTNTAYPGKYWISWWNSIHPGNVIDYRGSGIFSSKNINYYEKIKCDSLSAGACGKQGCMTEQQARTINQGTLQKITSTYYNSCGLFDGKCSCWGQEKVDGITLDVPTHLKRVIFKTISSGWDFTIGALSNGGLTAWGKNQASVFSFPEKYKNNSSNIQQLEAGGAFCAILDADRGLTLWGSRGYQNRLATIPRIALKTFEVTAAGITLLETSSYKREKRHVNKGEIIPFWGNRSTILDQVKRYEESLDEFGVQVDPISIDMPFDWISTGRRHIIGKFSFPVLLNLWDLGKHINPDESDENLIQLEDPYGFKFFPLSSDFNSRRIETKIFSWGSGMPGDAYDDDNGNLRQSAINYLWFWNSYQCKAGMNSIPMHFLLYTDFGVVNEDGISLKEETAVLHDDATGNPLIFTSSLADHTVFLRRKYLNICDALTGSSDTDYIALQKNGDAARCEYFRTLNTSPEDKCCDQVGGIDPHPQGDCCCVPKDGCNTECETWSDGDIYPCCKEDPITLFKPYFYSYIDRNTATRYNNGLWSCCHPNTLQRSRDLVAVNAYWECCNSNDGVYLDGWGNDKNNQLSHIGIKDTPEYFTANGGMGYINRHLHFLKPEKVGINKNNFHSIRCSLGPDRTVVTTTVETTEEDLRYDQGTQIGQITTKIFGAGDNINCLQGILDYNGGGSLRVDYLNVGGSHNNLVQLDTTQVKIDFPYKGEIDKSIKTNSQNPNLESAATPEIYIKPSTQKAETYYQPVFDPDTASQLWFKYNLKIKKWKDTPSGSKELMESLEIQGDPNKKYKLIGVRGDQRIKPFTGATCDCVWSDYATDSFKIGGHQGSLINHIGYDYEPELRDYNGSTIGFNQLVGNAYRTGGMEHPWRNFDSAGTKPFSTPSGNYMVPNRKFYPGTGVDLFTRNDLTPSINYWLAPPNSFTHTLIELPPGKFPSQLSYPCREKYCYGGNNNIIRNWCDPCARGFTNISGVTVWQGRLGCTGCELNNTEGMKKLCETNCYLDEYGSFVCNELAPYIKEVYDYNNHNKVFGNIIPDEIILTRTVNEQDDEISKLKPELKNRWIYQEETYIDPEAQEEVTEWWTVGYVSNIEKRTLTFDNIDKRDEEKKQKPLDPSKPFAYGFTAINDWSGEVEWGYTFGNYTLKKYDNDINYYRTHLSLYNSFGELSTPIEEAWPSLNRYLIPRWGIDDVTQDKTKIYKNGELIIDGTQQQEEIDYPLVIVPAHGGDIGTKYNMEGYFDTEIFSSLYDGNEMFWAPFADAYEWTTSYEWFKPAPKKVYKFMPGKDYGAFHKSRYIRDSIDFEYPFNKNIGSTGPGRWNHAFYSDFRPNKEFFIEFTDPPPGVFFNSKDIMSVNKRLNGKGVVEPLCGDTEVGCSSCSIPFTGAEVAAWGFDLYNREVVKYIQEITGLNGDLKTDDDIGSISSGQFWIGIAKDRLGENIKRLRVMMPVDLQPGEVLNFGKGVKKSYRTNYFYTTKGIYSLEIDVELIQPPNDSTNYKHRWGRFNDECSCNSRIQSEEPYYTSPSEISNPVTSALLSKFQTSPDQLTAEERASLITGLDAAGGIALVQNANCENTVTYLESGQSPNLKISTGGKSMNIGLSDMESIVPIWDKTMNGNGYTVRSGGVAFNMGYFDGQEFSLAYHIGPEITTPLLHYTGNARGAGQIWISWQPTKETVMITPTYDPSGTGIRGFYSDLWSSRGYSNFYTDLSSTLDDSKDRVAGDIPLEASHPQGWLGAAFVNSTDGYWTTVYGGDSVGDIITTRYKRGPTTEPDIYDPYSWSTSGTRTSSWMMYVRLKVPETENYSPSQLYNYGESVVVYPARAIDEWNRDNPGGDFYPRTQNKKRQVLKTCCFGDGFLNETPSTVTNAILSDKYTYNVKRNKYRNLYNAMFHSYPINKGSNSLGVKFRKWHGDPFNGADYDARLTKSLTPVWADYWYAWEGLYSPCNDGHNWFRSIQYWRHRRWQLPLFIGVNKDNLASIFINNPGLNSYTNQQCTPETCPGWELYDRDQISTNGHYRLGWNHRKYDSITAQASLRPTSLVFGESVRGWESGSSISQYPTVDGKRGCACGGYSSMNPHAGTFWSMNAPIWYNCYANFDFSFFTPGTGSVIDVGDILNVAFTLDFSHWNRYFQWLGPGYRTPPKVYSASIINDTWY